MKRQSVTPPAMHDGDFRASVEATELPKTHSVNWDRMRNTTLLCTRHMTIPK